MKRRWVGECRHCGLEHPAAGPRAWLRWYRQHLRTCEAWRAIERRCTPAAEDRP